MKLYKMTLFTIFTFSIITFTLFPACDSSSNSESGSGTGSPDKDITAFSIVNPAVTGIIDQDSNSITFHISHAVNRTALIANFTTTGSSVKVGTNEQVSGVTTNDFTGNVIYTVIAENLSDIDYTVTPQYCTDGSKNGNETDIDCGGSTCSTTGRKCGFDKVCTANSDCVSGTCSGGKCTAISASCSDGVKNGSETDTDCGGSSCNSCALNKDCSLNSDCNSGVCSGNKCVIP